MTAIRPRPRAVLAPVHPYVVGRRINDIALAGLSALIPAALAIGTTIALPHESLLFVLALIAGAIAIVALIVSSRLDVTVTLLILYLGLLDGPVKLLFSNREATAGIEDVLIVAICLGALMRMAVRKERLRMPPLSGWVLAWVVLVLVNAFNPRTEGIAHVLGGFRNQLAFVPFFFFGYALIRSKRRFRQLFLMIGVLALAGGAVAAYQTELSPAQLASWGPGYHALIYPTLGSGRVYFSEGEARVRPPGLGSEAGASGSIGHVALPMCLALVAITRRRKRWIAGALCLGALVAVIVGLGRTQLIGTGLGVIAFAVLSSLSGRNAPKAIGALLAIAVLAIPTGAILVSTLRSGTFKRYETIGLNQETTLHKESSWSKIPKIVAGSPLGYGLGNSGSVANFGGSANNNLLEGHGLTSETQYNVLVKELGLPGLILWPLMSIYVSFLILRRMRLIRDPELAICLAGALAAFITLPIEGFTGFLNGSADTGAYFWFAIGVAAYWLAGPGLARARGLTLDGDDSGASGEQGVQVARGGQDAAVAPA
jgi:hypothetical protein